MLLAAVLAIASASPPVANDAATIIYTAWSDKRCNITITHAFDKINGTIIIDTSPFTPFENPRLSALNDTAWEQWYFDSESSDGQSNLVVTFFRDPTLHTGLGGNWVMVDNVFANGTRTSNMTFVAESIISVCPRHTIGLWRDNTTSTSFIFTIDSNLKTAKLIFDTPNIRGTWKISTLAPPRLPSGALSAEITSSSTLEFAPYLWWTEAMPGGTVSTKLVIKGTPFSFKGHGGVDYFVGTYIWNYICTDWFWMRQIVGPYVIVYWQFGSYIDGKTHISAFLSKIGERIFSATQRKEDLTASYGGPYAHLTLGQAGKVRGGFRMDGSSFGLDFVDPKNEKSWHFELNHQVIGFETAPEIKEAHFTRFVDKSWGGEVGEKNYTGAGNSEQMTVVVNFPLPN